MGLTYCSAGRQIVYFYIFYNYYIEELAFIQINAYYSHSKLYDLE